MRVCKQFKYFILVSTLFLFNKTSCDDDLYDLKQEGYEQYQDIYVNGKVIEKASYAERFLEQRFAIVNSIFSRFHRPITVLDIGSAQGYFSFRGAETYPKSVFVMLEGSNPAYPLISKQVSSICGLNSHLDNVIWFDMPIIPEKVHALSSCEHFDVILLLNILHWFPNDWKTLLDAALKMSQVTVFELPPWEENLPKTVKDLRFNIHCYLSSIAQEVVEGVPRHNDMSLHTRFYIVENGNHFLIEKNSLLHPLNKKRRHVISCDYKNKTIQKEDCAPPFNSYVKDWIPGVNLITYLMFNGAFPSRVNIAHYVPVDIGHKDWMPNNMIVQGKHIFLIDKNDPQNETGEITDVNLYSQNRKQSLEYFILHTQNASWNEIEQAFRDFCKTPNK